MKILGLQKLTLLDFPGRVAAIVFTGGCNFRCPFCQNSSLVLAPQTVPEISEEEFRQFLRRRRGLLDGICVTGGEPTLHADLPEFLASVRDAGYLVKLDTNGTHPAMLEALLSDGLLDYVAMDIKAGPENYARVCGLKASARSEVRSGLSCKDKQRAESGSRDGLPREGTQKAESKDRESLSCENSGQTPESADLLLANVRRSVELLMNSDIEYEFRTTVVKGLHTARDFEEIASWLSGCRAYFLQSFRDCPEVLLENHPFSAFSDDDMREFLKIAQKKIPQAALRGI